MNRKKNKFRYRHLSRYGEIVSILIKYGFGDILSRINIEKYLSAWKNIFRKVSPDSAKIAELSRWDRITLALEELGPTFIKLGQFASNRPDILPVELLKSLEKLQDSVPPFDENLAIKIVEEELQRKIDSIFSNFSLKPFASASIAQVHKATLLDGREVAVKIQRPNVVDIISVDLEIMRHIASLMERYLTGIKPFEPVKLVDEFANAIKKELDFTNEALHILHFKRIFVKDPTIHIPDLYSDYSTKRVLTTEFIKGIKISQVEKLFEAGYNPVEIARRGANAILKQIFEYGFFHADPHSGNILVTDNNVICFLDLGMTGTLTPRVRKLLKRIIIGIVRQNPTLIISTLEEMAGRELKYSDELEYEIFEMIQEYSPRAIGSINIGEILNRLFNIMITYQIKIMPGFYLLIKAMVTIEGIGYKLNPDFNMIEYLEPFVKKIIKEQYSLMGILQEGEEIGLDFFTFIKSFPSEVKKILQMLKAGQMKFEFEHIGLYPITKKIDQAVNRLVYGLVLASLIIGSSIVIHSAIPPKIYGLPIIGIIGFLTAGIMGFGLIISIIWKEKIKGDK
ncbi:MAG: AarF/UbiB family protein [Chitinispirillaceae bacterium]|nr:AarF/UbiB family protein [Chitinispirillaceae bacterium]